MPPPFDKAFVLKGQYCPSMHFVLECILKDRDLEVHILDEKFAMKNMNFGDSTVEDHPEGFQRVTLSSDPLNASVGNVILLPYLEEGETRSIVEVARKFASSMEPGYLLISGDLFSGKTEISQTIIPMIMSTEPSLRSGLFVYQDFSFICGGSIGELCSNFIKRIQHDYLRDVDTSEIFKWGEETKIERLFTNGLPRILHVLKAFSNRFGIVLVLDNFHLLFHHIAEDFPSIKEFLQDLIAFTSENTLKLVLAMDETILPLFNIAYSDEIIKLKEKCTRIDLPSKHSVGLLRAADELIKEDFRKYFTPEYSDITGEVQTAFAKILVSNSLGCFSSITNGIDSVRSIAFNKYSSRIGWHLIKLRSNDKDIYSEIIQIAETPKTITKLDDLKLVGSRFHFLLKLMDIKCIDESSLSVNFKSPYIMETIRRLAKKYPPDEYIYRPGQRPPFKIVPFGMRIEINHCLYAASLKKPEKVACISELLEPLCKKYQLDAAKAALRLINTEYNSQTRRRGLSKLGIN